MFGRSRGHVRKLSAETLDPNVQVQSREDAGTAGFMSGRQEARSEKRLNGAAGPSGEEGKPGLLCRHQLHPGIVCVISSKNDSLAHC